VKQPQRCGPPLSIQLIVRDVIRVALFRFRKARSPIFVGDWSKLLGLMNKEVSVPHQRMEVLTLVDVQGQKVVLGKPWRRRSDVHGDFSI
jgi:hypothetical protein